jgi:hypothetical protein
MLKEGVKDGWIVGDGSGVLVVAGELSRGAIESGVDVRIRCIVVRLGPQPHRRGQRCGPPGWRIHAPPQLRALAPPWRRDPRGA